MSIGLGGVLLIPLAGAATLALVGHGRAAGHLNSGFCGLTLAATLWLAFDLPPDADTLFADEMSIVFLLLNAVVAFTTSLFSSAYVRHEVLRGRLNPINARIYHGLYQMIVFGMNLALVSNNIGLMWAALELATLSTVVVVGIYRTPAALEAAWKYFILASVGISLALFGTILIYMAAQTVLGPGHEAMLWTELVQAAPRLDRSLLGLAFIFLLVGYGTKVGLVPLHAWLPDAHAEGPTPISAILSGLMLNVALYILLRFKMIMAANGGAALVGPMMMGLGLASVLFAAFMLYRRHDIKRLFAYSSIEHMGIIVFAFGLAGPLANFAGVLQMTLHTLTKSAIFFAVGHIAQIKNTQDIFAIGGLTRSHPVIGWSLVAGVAAIVGLPPFGLFMSEFLLLNLAFEQTPILAILLGVGLLTALGALLLHLGRIAFGPLRGASQPVDASVIPLLVHVVMVAAAGIYLPGPVVRLFENVARFIG